MNKGLAISSLVIAIAAMSALFVLLWFIASPLNEALEKVKMAFSTDELCSSTKLSFKDYELLLEDLMSSEESPIIVDEKSSKLYNDVVGCFPGQVLEKELFHSVAKSYFRNCINKKTISKECLKAMEKYASFYPSEEVDAELKSLKLELGRSDFSETYVRLKDAFDFNKDGWEDLSVSEYQRLKSLYDVVPQNIISITSTGLTKLKISDTIEEAERTQKTLEENKIADRPKLFEESHNKFLSVKSFCDGEEFKELRSAKDQYGFTLSSNCKDVKDLLEKSIKNYGCRSNLMKGMMNYETRVYDSAYYFLSGVTCEEWGYHRADAYLNSVIELGSEKDKKLCDIVGKRKQYDSDREIIKAVCNDIKDCQACPQSI
jgi:hypothetical protein